MHVIVINRSGNSGKSTLSDYMLAPRMDKAHIIRVETINAHEGDEADNLKGKQYGEIIDGISLFENAIVDVGSSNVQDFMTLMAQYTGSHEVFDYFVVPTVAHVKQIRDTIRTIESLSDIGVSPEKIRVVFNMVEDEDTDIEKTFPALFAYYNEEGKFTLNKEAVVYHNELYSRLSKQGITVEDILKDTTDYNKLLKEAESPQEKIEISKQRSNRFLAKGLKDKLDAAFNATFG